MHPIKFVLLLATAVTASIPYINSPKYWQIRPEVLAAIGDDYQIINKTVHVQRNSTVSIECKAPTDAPQYWEDTLFFWTVHTPDGFKVC